MALKMLGKKGTVTKIKALQSFLQDILPPKKGPEIRGMVGHFVQLFATEMRDQKDRKVRQLMTDVLLVLATKLRPKAFAPHLRRLMPYWLIAMHDPSAETAKTALQALEALFPENQEMQDEVIATHLGAILQEFAAFFQHTPDSFPGVALADDDERQERYERCVTAAVLSLNTLTSRFSVTGNTDKLTEDGTSPSFLSVVTSGNFGRLVAATSKNANFSRDSIRKATYVTIQSLCVRTPTIIRSREEHFGKLVLGAISDKDPANQQALWDMVLTYLQSAPSHWSEGFVKFVKSAVLPRLFAQIRHGFFGSARGSFPVLLPLLSMFPLEHFLDAKTGHCALYAGVLENVWKFVASNESRYHETVAIEAASECLSAFLELFIKSPKNAPFTTSVLGPENDAIADAYVGQFEKSIKDAFSTLFTSPKLSVEDVELFAKSWSAMMAKNRDQATKSSTESASSSLMNKFLVLSEGWLLSVLESAVTVGSLRATHVVAYLRLSSTRAQSTALASVCNRLYTSCIAQLSRKDFSCEVLDVMSGLYEIVGLETLVSSNDEDVDTHFAKHLEPLLHQAAASSGTVSNDVISSALNCTRQFMLAASDKRKFLLDVFQDFGVQYGDMSKASTLIEKCLRFPFSHEAAAVWVTTGSFSGSVTATQENSAEGDLLRAIWSGKLLDEFVMISLKGRLDDLDEDAFARLLNLCLGDDARLPLVSPDVVVILSHFAIQQKENHVVMRILPSLVSLFAKLHCQLPQELETAEEQILGSLYHLAAKSSFKIEASRLWTSKARAVTDNWNLSRRERLTETMVKVINDDFEAEDSSFNPRIWASYVNIYMQLGLHLQANESCAVSLLLNRLRIFSHRFEGSRLLLTKMYDRLLGCVAELCEDEISRVWLATYFEELSRDTNGSKAAQLLLRWLDIDVCHALTCRVLQNDFSATEFVTLDQLSLQLFYNVLKATPTANGAFTTFINDASTTRWESRHRRVLFTNQDNEERNLDVASLETLTDQQHMCLDTVIGRVLSDVTSSEEIAKSFIGAVGSDCKNARVFAALTHCFARPELLTEVTAQKLYEDTKRWPSESALRSVSALIAARHGGVNGASELSPRPWLTSIASTLSVSSSSRLDLWLDAADCLVAIVHDSAMTDSDTKSEWMRAAKAAILHALAGKQDASEVAALRVHKRSYEASSHESADDILAYSVDTVRSRRRLAQLISAAALVDSGEVLQELATHHREALLSTVLVSLAEGLDVCAKLVPAYVNLSVASESLQVIQLAEELGMLLTHAAQALPVIAIAIHDMDRVKTLLFEAFGSADALAACFNTQGAPLASLVRIQFYVLATATAAFKASAGGCDSIDLNADDEDATEAALADSIIPPGLRDALHNAFARSTTNDSKGKPRRRQHLELDDTITRLLAWDLFLQLFPTSGGNTVGMVASALSAFATRHGLLSSFLDMVGTLLSQESGSAMAKRLLKDEPFFDITELASDALTEDRVDSSLVVQLAARAFFRTVMRLPAMVRTWWNDECSRSLRSWATKYFEEHITPYVLSTELEIIQKAADLHSWDAEEMTVKGSRVSREITAIYVKDECALEMVIRVPSAYPLRSVEVECTRRIGISEDRWRRWVLQIIKVTSAQDGSLLDAVLLWKQNVDREFEGVEPCPICYSILNPKTRGLPNLPCKTCSNKYHNSCLYKWFNQSGKNKCPICQQPFT
ncbi:hypothetical protein PINS_up002700 [Pythium insidiosum]|nr:hypothetical protein PINS_up002700 [Pythium insidiosum]